MHAPRGNKMICVILLAAATVSVIAGTAAHQMEVAAAVLRVGARYRYAYTLTNVGAEALTLSSFCVDSPGVTPNAPHVPETIPVRWEDPLTKGLAAWDLFRTPLGAGGGSVTLSLESAGPPSIRRAFLYPRAQKPVEAYLKAREAKHCIPKETAIWDIRKEAAVQLWTLGPLEVTPGTYAHFNRFEEDVQLARTLGWIPKEGLAASLELGIHKIRRAMLSGNRDASAQEWKSLVSLVEDTTDTDRRPEVLALVRLTAEVFRSARPSPCEPALQVESPAEAVPVSEAEIIRVRLHNRAGPSPLTGEVVHFSVVAGPHKGLAANRTTDTMGETRLTLQGVADGVDKLVITVLPAPGHPCPSNRMTAQASARWSGGPNLKIFWSSASRLYVKPGRDVLVSESVRNLGNRRAGPSVVRYYLSKSPEWNEGHKVLWGMRAVPPLDPGEESRVEQAPVPLPVSIAPGLYFFHAAVNEGRKIVETCYWDDHSVNFFSREFRSRPGVGLMAGVVASPAPPEAGNVSYGAPNTHEPSGAVPWVDERYILPPKKSSAGWSIGPPDSGSPASSHAVSSCLSTEEWTHWARGRRRVLLVPLRAIPDRVLKDAIGEASVSSASDDVNVPPASPPREGVVNKDRTRGYLRRYDEGPGGFKPAGFLPAGALHPLTENRYDGVLRHFPVTRQRDGFLEIVYDVRKNLRAWVRMTRPDTMFSGSTPSVNFTPFNGDQPITHDWREAVLVDLNCLRRDPFVRLYKAPDVRAPWRLLDRNFRLSLSGEEGVELIVGQRNGFGLLALDSCDGKERVLMGWVPLRDAEGRLLVWVSDDSGCC